MYMCVCACVRVCACCARGSGNKKGCSSGTQIQWTIHYLPPPESPSTVALSLLPPSQKALPYASSPPFTTTCLTHLTLHIASPHPASPTQLPTHRGHPALPTSPPPASPSGAIVFSIKRGGILYGTMDEASNVKVGGLCLIIC